MTATTEQVWVGLRQRLLDYVRVRSRSAADADDILQNVFVKVHVHLATVEDERRLTSWLYRVTHNEIVDYYRKQRPIPHRTAESLAVDDDTADDDDSERRLAPFLRDLIEELPDRYKDALILTEIEGLTQREMGRRLGLTISGAKSRVQRGRAMLRDRLLDCCRVELDCRKHVIDYQPRIAEPMPEDCPCAPQRQTTQADATPDAASWAPLDTPPGGASGSPRTTQV